MLDQIVRILKVLYSHQVLLGQNCTVGELARATKIPYSTVKRRLISAEKSKLIESEAVPYKSTGKVVFWLNDDGMDFVECSRELS